MGVPSLSPLSSLVSQGLEGRTEQARSARAGDKGETPDGDDGNERRGRAGSHRFPQYKLKYPPKSVRERLRTRQTRPYLLILMGKLAMIKQIESSHQNNFGRHPASPLDTCIV